MIKTPQNDPSDERLEKLVQTLINRYQEEKATMEGESMFGSISCQVVMDRYRSLLEKINEIYGTHYKIPKEEK